MSKKSKYTDADVEGVRQLAAEGWSQSRICKETGMSPSQVWRILNGLSRRPPQEPQPDPTTAELLDELLKSQQELVDRAAKADRPEDGGGTKLDVPNPKPKNPYY